MRYVRRRNAAVVSLMVLGLSLASGLSFGDACGPSASCPMVSGGTKSHCQPASAITADCCANMAPVASQTTPARAMAEPTPQAAPHAPSTSPLDSVERLADRPAMHSARLHDIGRHTLFQVFLS